MAEMMVNLRVLRDLEPVLDEQRANGFEIRRARIEESAAVCEWVNVNINPNWRVACEVALEQTPPNCFIAYRLTAAEEEKDFLPESIAGFACYDVVKKGVFGPAGVREDLQETDLSTALMLVCLHAMAAENNTEAVIGWAGTVGGYSV